MKTNYYVQFTEEMKARIHDTGAEHAAACTSSFILQRAAGRYGYKTELLETQRAIKSPKRG